MLKDLLSKKTLTSALISVLLIGISIYAWLAIPVEVMPKDGVPPFLMVRVNTATPQDPRLVEVGIGTAVEGALKTVSRTIGISSSIDSSGVSTSLRFKPKTNLDLATIQIGEALGPLDDAGLIDINSVNVIRLNPDAVAVMKLSVSNPFNQKIDLNALRDELRIQLESVKGVAKVEIIAMENPSYELSVDTGLLNKNKISASRFAQLVRPQVFSEKVGSIIQNGNLFPVTMKNQPMSLQFLLDHPLRYDTPVSVSALSTLKVYSRHESEVIHFNGDDTFFFEIFPKDSANLLNLNENMQDALEKIRASPRGSLLKFETIFNQTDELRSSIEEVFASLLQAMIITFAIVLLFYRKLNQTLIVNLSIPLTLLITVLLMYLGKSTLNILTLSGLILGIGMVVDNAVLVIDRIDELNERIKTKLNLRSNAGQAAADVSTALVLSSLTNALIFLPVVFIEGNDSFIDLIRAFQLPILGSLAASLVVSLLILPLIKMKWKGSSSAKSDGSLTFYLNLMKGLYRWRKPLSIISVFAFLFVLDRVSEMDSTDIDPPRDPYINVFVKFSNEIKTEERKKLFLQWEKDFLKEKGEINFKFALSEFDPRNSTGTLTFYPNKSDDSDHALDNLNKNLRKFVNSQVTQIGVQVDVGQPTFRLSAGRSKLDFLVEAPNQASGDKLVAELRKYLEKENGFVDVVLERDDRAEKQVNLSPNYGALGTSKINLSGVQQAIAPYLSQLTLGHFLKGEESVEVRSVIPSRLGSWSLEQILDLTIPVERGQVRVGDVVSPSFENSSQGIQRKAGKSQIRLFVYLEGATQDLAAIKSSFAKKMAKFSFPLGMGYAQDDSTQRIEEMKRKTNFVILLSVFLIYVVLAAMFESLLLPIAIIFSIPMALVFGAGGLWALGQSLDVMARLGLVILVGVGVNNAIMLIDMIIGLRNEGLARKEAILVGCAKRLRAVFMTTAIQVISVLPVALGKSKLMGIPYASLGIVMISGMIFSTIITIVLLPVLYEACDTLDMKMKGTASNRQP
jgi:HAE1 family hydrophobic/amphiphilic exporter-1